MKFTLDGRGIIRVGAHHGSHHRGSGINESANDIVNRAAGVLVVAGYIGKGPGISVIGTDSGMGGGAQVEAGKSAVSTYALAAAGRSVRGAVIDHGVASNRAGGIRFIDRDRTGGGIGQCFISSCVDR